LAASAGIDRVEVRKETGTSNPVRGDSAVHHFARHSAAHHFARRSAVHHFARRSAVHHFARHSAVHHSGPERMSR
jgi:hypothetical protein